MFLSKLLVICSFIVSLIIDAAISSPISQWQSQLSNTPSDWQKYVRSPKSNTITPARIVSDYTLGNVTNPDGLLTTGTEPTILTRPVPSNSTTGNSLDTIPTIVVDFGQNVVGFLSINFAGGSNSTKGLPGIRLAFSESIDYGYLTNVSDFSRSDNADAPGLQGKITPGSDQIAVKSSPYVWTDTFGCDNANTFQVCADGIHGFRYLKIYMDALPTDAPYTSSYGYVAIDSISLNYTAYLGTPESFTGWFQSSDEDLNQWWYDAIYTNDMNLDTFTLDTTDPRQAFSPTLDGKLVLLDGAKRDRDPYVGDIAVSGRTLYLSHDVPQAARNVLADLADHQRADGWIPPASIRNYTLKLLDYPLWWVACNYDLLLYTGDIAYVQQYYQNMVETLDTFYPSVTDNATLLISKGVGISAPYGDYAFINRTGAVTYYNALYVIALNNAASIATYIGGHEDDAERWTKRAKDVSDAINRYMFDESVGAFYDSFCGSTQCQTHAQDGNSLSIVSGTASSTRAESILSYMEAKMARPYGHAFYDNSLLGKYSDTVYAFMSYFELEARFLTGEVDSALKQIRSTYGWMASNDPGITMWEGIGKDGLPYQGDFTSLAHGWSTGIVPVATNYILGVTPTGPGFSTWNLKPITGDVSWAKGVVPTPKGSIAVYWNQNPDTDEFYLTVDVPTGTVATISVPASSTVIVYLDHQVYNAQIVGGYATFDVQGGQHNVSVGFDGHI